MKISEFYANDWFTIGPKYRTKERLAQHIQEAIDDYKSKVAIAMKYADVREENKSK